MSYDGDNTAAENRAQYETCKAEGCEMPVEHWAAVREKHCRFHFCHPKTPSDQALFRKWYQKHLRLLPRGGEQLTPFNEVSEVEAWRLVSGGRTIVPLEEESEAWS